MRAAIAHTESATDPAEGVDPVSVLHLDRLHAGDLVLIRQADRGDHDAISAMGAACLDTLVRPRLLTMAPSRPTRRLLDISDGRRSDGACLVGVDPIDGTVLGVASHLPFRGREDMAEAWVLVDREHRCRGIATALLERLATVARGRGCTQFRLDVRPSDPRMLRVLRHVGARPAAAPPAARTVELVVPLADDGGLGVPLGTALWAVARGGLTAVALDEPGAP